MPGGKLSPLYWHCYGVEPWLGLCDYILNSWYVISFNCFTAKAEITDEKLEELLEQGSYGSIFNGDVSSRISKFENEIWYLNGLIEGITMLVDYYWNNGSEKNA